MHHRHKPGDFLYGFYFSVFIHNSGSDVILLYCNKVEYEVYISSPANVPVSSTPQKRQAMTIQINKIKYDVKKNTLTWQKMCNKSKFKLFFFNPK